MMMSGWGVKQHTPRPFVRTPSPYTSPRAPNTTHPLLSEHALPPHLPPHTFLTSPKSFPKMISSPPKVARAVVRAILGGA